MLRVLGKASSINVRKVLWAIDEIGLPYEREDWGSGFKDTRSDAYLKLNPNALVPVIIDGGFVLWESNTIIRYLAAQYGAEGLLPSDPRARAGIEKWMDWQVSELNPSWSYAFQALVRKNPDYSDAALLQTSVGNWSRNISIVAGQLEQTQGYIAGEHFTLADIPIGLSIHRWFMTPIDQRTSHPAIDAYYERLSGRPAFMAHGRNGIA